MAGIRIEGNVSGNVAEVANNALQVNLPISNTTAGFAAVLFENDPGAVTGLRDISTPYISKYKRLSMGLDTVIGSYFFTPIVQHTGDFKYATSTLTMNQSAGFLNINPALSTAVGIVSLTTWRHFSLLGDNPLQLEGAWSISAALPTNQFFEWGLFLATSTGTTPPADGVFFRHTAVGLTGVTTFSGVETETGVLAASTDLNVVFRYKIIINKHTVSFWKNDILLAQLLTPTALPIPFLSVALPITAQQRNSVIISGGATVKLASEIVTMKDIHSSKPWPYQMGTMGRAYQGQGGDTMGQLSVWVNASLPTATILTNTSGAFTGLGGLAYVTVTFAAGTDGIIFSYQNPVGSVSIPPKTLVVTGITISDVLGTVLATSPLAWAYGVAYGHTGVALSTTEIGSFTAGATKSPRRIAIGTSGYALTAAVGTSNNPINITFQTPIVVNPGEFFAIFAKTIITAPSSGAVVVTATVDHYFE